MGRGSSDELTRPAARRAGPAPRGRPAAGRPGAASAQAAGDEGMDSFAAVYDLQPDGSMKVTETITWRFPSGEQRHGIFRNIVVRMGYNDEADRYRYYDLTDVDVSSPTGAPDAFRVSDNGAAQEIRIGSADEYTSGTQVYEVRYTLHNVLNPITADGKPATGTTPADTVELYYNVFGTNELTAARPGLDHGQRAGGVDQGGLLPGRSRLRHPVPGQRRRPSRFSASALGSGDAMTVIASYPASAFGDVRADVRAGQLRLLGRLRLRPRPPTPRPGSAASVPRSWPWPSWAPSCGPAAATSATPTSPRA